MYTMCLLKYCPCSAAPWSTSVIKYFDHDQLLQYPIQTIQFLGFSFRDDIVAVGCSHRVRLKAVRNLVTYLECAAYPASLRTPFMCSRKRRDARLVPYITSFHLPHVSRFFFTTRRIHRIRVVLWQQCMPERNADVV